MGIINHIHQLFRKALRLGDMDQLLFETIDFSAHDFSSYEGLLQLLESSSNQH